MNAILRKDESCPWLGTSPVAALIRGIDWAGSPLGPIPEWEPSLRTALSICLHAASPMAVYWGEDLLMLYNDVCAQTLGDRHPAALGAPAAEVFADIWDFVGPILKGAYTQGSSTGARNQAPVAREGRVKDLRFDYTANPVRDDDGNIVGVLAVAFDITDHLRTAATLTAEMVELQRLQTQQHVLVAELHHRTRNLLAVIRAIASQSFDGELSEASLEAFLERLSALGRAQSLIGRSEYERVSLSDIVWAELEAYAPRARRRLEVHGPMVRLTNNQVQTVALALHELVTNAVKYGALQVPGGRLSITWETWLGANGQQRLALLWKESGVALPPSGEIPRGQGRELIENSLRFSLRAETQLVFSGDGVWCRIELPLTGPPRAALDPTDPPL